MKFRNLCRKAASGYENDMVKIWKYLNKELQDAWIDVLSTLLYGRNGIKNAHIHAFLEFPFTGTTQILFSGHWLVPHIPIVEIKSMVRNTIRVIAFE